MQIISITNSNDVMHGSIIIKYGNDYFIYKNNSVSEISIPEQVYRFNPYFEKFSGDPKEIDTSKIELLIVEYLKQPDNQESHEEFIEIRESYGL